MAENIEPRQAFHYMQGYVTCSLFAALGTLGHLPKLLADGLRPAEVGENRFLAEASFRYLAQRGVVRQEGERYLFTETGRKLYEDRGYLLWLFGGYGEAMRSLDELLTGKQRFGTEVDRDVRWVAVGTALVGQQDLRPEVLKILADIEFTRVADLGCGNAHFLVALCGASGGEGIGVDISPSACEEAVGEVAKAGLADRIRIIEADAGKLADIPDLELVQLVVNFFFLHEVLEHGRETLVRYLRGMYERLPNGAHILTAEVCPPEIDQDTPELFSPEYVLTQAFMAQHMLGEQDWREVFEEAGFEVTRVVRPRLPEARLILARKP